MLGVAAVAGVAIAAGPVAAHECFNASRSDQANQEIAQHSNGWFNITTPQILAILISGCIQSNDAGCPITTTGLLSPTDTAYIQDPANDIPGEILGFTTPQSPAVQDLLAFTNEVATQAECVYGVPASYLTKPNSTAAGGAPTKVVSNGTGIDHFPDVYGQSLIASYNFVYGGGTPAGC
jgi:hypothetical protein